MILIKEENQITLFRYVIKYESDLGKDWISKNRRVIIELRSRRHYSVLKALTNANRRLILKSGVGGKLNDKVIKILEINTTAYPVRGGLDG